jgi:hypothetical protein
MFSIRQDLRNHDSQFRLKFALNANYKRYKNTSIIINIHYNLESLIYSKFHNYHASGAGAKNNLDTLHMGDNKNWHLSTS